MNGPERTDKPPVTGEASLTFSVSDDKKIVVENGLIRLPDGTAYKVTLRSSEGTTKTLDPNKRELSENELKLLKKVAKILIKAQEDKKVTFEDLSKTEITNKGIVTDQHSDPNTTPYTTSTYEHKFQKISNIIAQILQTPEPTTSPTARSKKEGADTESKVKEAARKSKVFGDYEEFARGKEKAVLRKIKRDSIPSSDLEQPEKVYYIPVTGFSLGKNALKKEKGKMDAIKKELDSVDQAHLAIETVEHHEKIRGRYTLEVEKAERNFEKEIQDQETTFEQRKDLGRHFLEGLAALHKAGWVYGDLKPENCLIYRKGGETILKIADFGKAEKVGDRTKTYRGNLRFSPPEGKLSKKGDVWGAALVLIRTLEEAILTDEEPLKAIKPENKRDDEPSEKIRGIERFVIQHNAFLGFQAKTLRDRVFKGLPRRAARLGKLSSKRRKQQSELIHQYIGVLTKKLLENDLIDASQEKSLKDLLMKMTKENPDDRISIEKALAEYQEIF